MNDETYTHPDFQKIMEILDKSYGDAQVSKYYEDEKAGLSSATGDTLAQFIVLESHDLFDSSLPLEQNKAAISKALAFAASQLDGAASVLL